MTRVGSVRNLAGGSFRPKCDGPRIGIMGMMTGLFQGIWETVLRLGRAQDGNEFSYWPGRHKAVSGIPASSRQLLLEPVGGGGGHRSGALGGRPGDDSKSKTWRKFRHSERSSGSRRRVRHEDAFPWDRSVIGLAPTLSFRTPPRHPVARNPVAAFPLRAPCRTMRQICLHVVTPRCSVVHRDRVVYASGGGTSLYTSVRITKNRDFP
jgi:hypothetical protein